MASAITARMTEWEKLLPRSYQLVHEGWRLDVWQFSGVPESWWYWSATRDGNYSGHGSQYETSDAACDAALKFANLTPSNVEDGIFLYGPSNANAEITPGTFANVEWPIQRASDPVRPSNRHHH